MFRSVPHRLAAFEHQVLPRVIAPLLGALLVIVASQHAARAQDGVFVISDSEGYGVMDCLTGGKSCGRIVADAWCEAHGFATARAYGPASDVTASTVTASTPAATPVKAATQIAPGSVIVACNP